MFSEQDLRVQKTLALIKRSFIKLIDEKGFSNITVNNISDEAMISRSTFYLHFTDKYDLLNKITDEAISSILNLVEPSKHIIHGSLNYNGFCENLSAIFHTLQNDALLYKLMLNDTEHLGLCRKCETILKNKLEETFVGEFQIPRDLFFELIVSLYVSTARWWLNHDMKYSPSFLAKEMVKFFTAVPCDVIGVAAEQTDSASNSKHS